MQVTSEITELKAQVRVAQGNYDHLLVQVAKLQMEMGWAKNELNRLTLELEVAEESAEQ